MPVWVRCGEYESGRFSVALARAVAPFTAEECMSLLTKAAETGSPIVVLLDGLNECAPQLQARLLEQRAPFACAYRRRGRDLDETRTNPRLCRHHPHHHRRARRHGPRRTAHLLRRTRAAGSGRLRHASRAGDCHGVRGGPRPGPAAHRPARCLHPPPLRRRGHTRGAADDASRAAADGGHVLAAGAGRAAATGGGGRQPSP